MNDKNIDYVIEIAPPAEELRVPLLEKQKEALKIAHDIRKFELDLYWRRAIYFWAFIVSIFTAFLALLTTNDVWSSESYKHMALMYVSIVGLMFSMAWYCVNRSSKHWQQNWEEVITQLEQNITGTIYYTNITNNTPCYHLLSAYPFSASKINQLMSLFIFFVWVDIFSFLLFKDEIMFFLGNNPSESVLWVFLFSLLVMLVILGSICLYRMINSKLLKKRIKTFFIIATCICFFIIVIFTFFVVLFCNLGFIFVKIAIFLSLFCLLGLVFFGFCKYGKAHIKNREPASDKPIYLTDIDFKYKTPACFYPRPYEKTKK